MSAESDSADDANATPGRPGLGRRILLSVGGVVVALAGMVGFFVGSNGAESVPRMSLLGGAVTFPTTPLSMTLYAALLATLMLSTLFGLVALASRYEDAE